MIIQPCSVWKVMTHTWEHHFLHFRLQMGTKQLGDCYHIPSLHANAHVGAPSFPNKGRSFQHKTQDCSTQLPVSLPRGMEVKQWMSFQQWLILIPNDIKTGSQNGNWCQFGPKKEKQNKTKTIIVGHLYSHPVFENGGMLLPLTSPQQ